MKFAGILFEPKLCLRRTTCFFFISLVLDLPELIPKSRDVRASKELVLPLLYLKSPT